MQTAFQSDITTTNSDISLNMTASSKTKGKSIKSNLVPILEEGDDQNS
jgi:hypothetical protein